jgi:hypothetical protein
MLSATAHADEAHADEAVFELRTYSTIEGRLPALEARFKNHTMGLFEKHGVKNVGYWVPTEQPNTLVYIIRHDNRDAAAASWAAFIADPDWQEVARKSQLDGQILIKNGIQSQFLRATDYSPIK